MRCAALSLLLLAACSKPDAKAILADRQPANLSDPQTVGSFGGKANAWWIYMFATQLTEVPFIGGAFGVPRVGDDACPSIRTAGNRRIFTGGCTTSTGIRIDGSAEIESSDRFRPARIVFNDYATRVESKCPDGRKVETHTRWRGLLIGSTGEDGVYTFDLDLAFDSTVRVDAGDDGSCTVRPFAFATIYHGTAVELAADNNGDDFPDESRFDGAGTFALADGKVEAITEGFHIVTDACVFVKEGKATLTAGDHEAIIEYGQNAECNENTYPATWSLDGEEKGPLALSLCNAGSPQLSLWLLLALALRRRSRLGLARERTCTSHRLRASLLPRC